MKALILAAGFGTRLLPFTQNRPKPLFTIANRPVLDIIIHDLQNAGCQEIIINTHHLHQKIESFIGDQEYTLPVRTCHETEILGTGGAIKNTENFWDGSPFIVINSDIFTDINIKAVYEFHLRHNHPATLVLHNYPEFNNVSVSGDGFITGFHNKAETPESKLLAFTGIQILDPKIVDFIPAGVFFSSIDLYRNLILTGLKVKSFISKNHFWRDIGTPQTYRKTVFEKMAYDAFRQAWPGFSGNKIIRKKLKGDGSDRKWYRLTSDDQSLVMVDHGIKIQSATSEADSFVAIGRHLHNKGIPVPKIHIYDTFSGQVFLEDLGDENLQSFVLKAESLEDIVFCYQSVINSLIHLSISGARQFDPSWTYQTPYYNKDLILSKECRYFVDAFLKGYLSMDSFFEDFENEFSSIADKALE
ncbi:MAG: NTP transferase domain-containing protein, partial [Deltaproteobacteria bacterium]|nr:NTP transferase domain-containing protein [Deltaproteobacteria bacterium]